MTMDLRRLRYFVAVAEERSVGRAAERLRIAQPPLSVQIRKLEADVGVSLFRRGTRGMELTEAGQALLSRATEAIAITTEGFEAARAIAAGARRRLCIGYMFALAPAILPRLVPEMRRILPETELEFVELSASTREARLLDYSVTVAICMPAIRHEQIEAARIGEQRLMLAVPADSALARLSSVPVRKLRDRSLIALPRPEKEPATSPVEALLRRHQISMRIVHRVETVHSAVSLVLAGEGLAIVPECVKVTAPKGVVFRPFADADDAIEVAVCWRRDSANVLLRSFLECAEKALRQISRDADGR
ncbi:LysR substrate-binding domain-containing protein [soil metagenome]